MQGVDGTFQLREFEAYETVNKDHLKETLKAADDKLKEYGIQYGDEKYKEFFAAYMEAESAYENAYALNHNVSEKADALKAETEKLENLNPKPEPTPELKSVTVTAESKKVKVGEETTVTAKVDPTDAKDVTIIWTTSDETVLKVDEAGKVTALKVGKATITATAVQGEKKVKVTDSVEIEVEEETATPTPNPDPQPTPEKNDGAVQTGDNVSPMLYAGAAMTAAAVLALIQRKRRKG